MDHIRQYYKFNEVSVYMQFVHLSSSDTILPQHKNNVLVLDDTQSTCAIKQKDDNYREY